MHDTQLYITKILKNLPQDLADDVDNLLKAVTDKNISNPIAAFDLDWTLLNGDVAESAYLHLLSLGYKLPLSWQQYCNLLNQGSHGLAFEEMVKAMAGLNLQTLYNSCDYVINHADEHIKYQIGSETIEFPAPSRNQTMYKLVSLLKLAEFRVAVISASPHYTVRYITSKYYGLTPDYCYGIKVAIDVDNDYNEYLTSQVIPPVTWGKGKTDVLSKIAGGSPVMLVAGDSKGDIPMMNMLSDDGLAIIRRSPLTNIEEISSQLNPNIRKIII